MLPSSLNSSTARRFTLMLTSKTESASSLSNASFTASIAGHQKAEDKCRLPSMYYSPVSSHDCSDFSKPDL